MGLLSKLTGGNPDIENAAKDLFGGLKDAAQQIQSGLSDLGDAMEAAGLSPENLVPKEAKEILEEERKESGAGASGFSYGPDMPDEENQFNYGGPFYEYFENIFGSEFPEFRFERELSPNGKRYTYRFYSGDALAMVVELIDQNNAAVALRNKCGREGIPYYRFCYNHQGWWNTRAYVVQRMNEALGRQ